MSAFPQFGLNYPGLSVSQMMAGSMQPGAHTPSCDVAHARPIMSDPHTGQTICSCQYDRFVRSCLPPVSVNSAAPNMNQLNSAASAAFGPFSLAPNPDHPPPQGMPSFLPGSYPPPPMNGPHDNMPLFASGLLSAGFPDLKEMAGDPVFRAAMMAQSGAGGCYPYEPPFGGGMYPPGPYCGNNYAMDPAGLNRRKNATRETTSQLKQWLSEHRKNPYPTKGEKIMLAIMTKMTLTQVSTWFANARRRLKKENKMTWSPRNRGCEDEDKSDGENDGDHENGDDFLDKDDGSLSEISSLTDDNGMKRTGSISPRDTKDSQPNQTGTQPASGCAGSVDSVNTAAINASAPVATKPRIWSLADMAGPGGNSSPHKTQLPPPPDQLPHPPLPLPFPPGAHPQTHPFLARMGPMLPPGPHPPWSPLFAASAAGSLLQSGALNSTHAAANFFTQNPNSAFSTPGRMPMGLMGPNGMMPPRGPVVSQSQGAVIRVKDEGAETNGPCAGTPPVKMHRAGNASPSENLRTPHNGPENMSVKIKLEKPSIARTVSHPENVKLNDHLQNSPPNGGEKKRKRSDSSDSRPLSPVA